MKRVLLLGMLAIAVAMQAQTFEVASIKPNESEGGPSSIRVTKGLIAIENATLRKTVLWAYGIPDDREYALVGPGWLGTERFNIQARFPENTTDPQVHLMMQALLAERFKLALHRETKQLPTYALVVDKSGAKIQPVADGQPSTTGRSGRVQATKVSMQHFADLLGRYLGQPVTDSTGLTGVFDFTLEWSPGPTEDPTAAGANGPSLFTALEEQLGLKLDSRKAPFEVLVVDRMEKLPTGN
jgi:uncharacterized protein (TIGR03435 family)